MPFSSLNITVLACNFLGVLRSQGDCRLLLFFRSLCIRAARHLHLANGFLARILKTWCCGSHTENFYRMCRAYSTALWTLILLALTGLAAPTFCGTKQKNGIICLG